MTIALARKQLQKERLFLGQKLERIDSALQALGGNGTVRRSGQTFTRSAAQRRRISQGIRKALAAKAKKQ